MFDYAIDATLWAPKPPTHTMEETMDRNQAFALLRHAGFRIDHVEGDRWDIGLTFPEAQGTSLAGEIHEERWIIGFAERFYHAYLEFVIHKADALLRAMEEQEAESIRRN
jgi:hypothetical protein